MNTYESCNIDHLSDFFDEALDEESVPVSVHGFEPQEEIDSLMSNAVSTFSPLLWPSVADAESKPLFSVSPAFSTGIKPAMVTIHQGYPTETLVQFLQARGGNGSKAHTMLVDCLNWRIPNEIDNILTAEELTVIWDMTVVGYEVSYKEEFIPDDDCSYTVLLQKEKKMRESTRNSFYVYEPGKIVITIDNGSSGQKKKIFLRHKCKPTLPLYRLKGSSSF